MSGIQKQKTIKIWGNDYELTFPKTGQFIDIQTIKAKLTEGQYDNFKILERDGIMATILVDMIATFNTLIPKLKEDLNVPGLLSLDLEKIIELAYIYKDEYLPWYEGIMDVIGKPKTEEKANA